MDYKTRWRIMGDSIGSGGQGKVFIVLDMQKFTNVNHIPESIRDLGRISDSSRDGRFIERFATAIVDIFSELIRLLTQDRAKETFYSCSEEELVKYLDLFWDLALNTNTRNIVFDNKNRLRKALKTLINIFGQLCNEYLKDESKKERLYIEPLEEIQEILNTHSSIEVQIDKIPGMYTEIRNPGDDREEIKIRNKIPLEIMLHTFGKIREVYKGYNRF